MTGHVVSPIVWITTGLVRHCVSLSLFVGLTLTWAKHLGCWQDRVYTKRLETSVLFHWKFIGLPCLRVICQTSFNTENGSWKTGRSSRSVFVNQWLNTSASVWYGFSNKYMLQEKTKEKVWLIYAVSKPVTLVIFHWVWHPNRVIAWSRDRCRQNYHNSW